LARYAELIGYTQCAFFGISHPDNPKYACREIWSKYQRDAIADALSEAQSMIEGVIGYPISPRWFTNEEHPYKIPVRTDFAKVIAIGTQVITVLGLALAVDHTNDPNTITFATPAGVTTIDDIHVFHPGTHEEITYENIAFVGGNIVITIPRCRLLLWSKQDNPPTGWSYSDDANFETTVDVEQYTNDTALQGQLVSIPTKCDSTCTESTHDVCLYILYAEIGTIKIGPVSANFASCTGPITKVRLNYKAGLTGISRSLESAIIRLAHSLLPEEPCGCDVIKRLWRRDTNIPVILDTERLNNPFGIPDGAWFAYRVATGMTVFTMSEFTGGRNG
jgi:hypothetical protein